MFLSVVILLLYCDANVGNEAFITSVSVRKKPARKMEQSWKLHKGILSYGRSSCMYNCEILFTGTLQISKSDMPFWSSGKALLKVQIGQLLKDIHCKYMTNTGTTSTPTDTPHTTGLAVLCNIVSSRCPDNDGAVNIDFDAPAATFCQLFDDSRPSILEFTLFSLCASLSTGKASACNATRITVVISPAAELWHAPAIATTTPRASQAVCTVQTFQNEMSGPMLHMFARYYLDLGWTVIVYDRFGAHERFLTELIDSVGKLKYYPFTLFQLLFPDTYNSKFAVSQTKTITHYEKLSPINSVGNQDSDKRRTYAFARQQFRAIRGMLFVDRDELLMCPSSISSKEAQTKAHAALLNSSNRELKLQWVYYSPLHQSKTSSQIGDGLYHQRISQCVSGAYSNRNASQYLSCFTGYSVHKEKGAGKSVDVGVGEVCPFYGLHKGCYRCRCMRAVEPVENCHIMHLSNVNNPYDYAKRSHQRKRTNREDLANVFQNYVSLF